MNLAADLNAEGERIDGWPRKLLPNRRSQIGERARKFDSPGEGSSGRQVGRCGGRVPERPGLFALVGSPGSAAPLLKLQPGSPG